MEYNSFDVEWSFNKCYIKMWVIDVVVMINVYKMVFFMINRDIYFYDMLILIYIL